MSSGLYSGVSGLALGSGLYRNVSGLWGGASGLTAGFGGGSPYGGASLYLDFLSMTAPTFDNRITFTRGSNATLTDSTGKVTYAPSNLLTYSQEFDNAAWTKNNPGVAALPVVTANAGVAPDGTTTADRIQFNCVDVGSAVNRSLVTANPSQPTGVNYVGSVWVKAYDVANVGKTLRFAVDAFGSGVFTLTSEWQRIKINGLATATVGNFILETRGTFTTQTADALIWGAQLEAVTYQTTPGTYVATTSSAYYGPRFDYDPVTLAAKGLLIEEARTNLLTYSNDVSNAAWSKTNITVTAAATASPDGTVNAQKLTATAAAATVINSTPVAVAATSATYSIYVKQGTGATTANLFILRNSTTATLLIAGTLNYSTGVWTYSTGSTGVTVANVGSGWWRLQITATAGITSGDLLHGYIGWGGAVAAAGDFLYAYGAQLEAGAFATSYIPTVASTVTRSADVATMTGTNFSSWYNQSAGTFVVGADVNGSSATNPALFGATDGTPNNRINPFASGTNWVGYVSVGGVAQAAINSAGYSTGTPFKYAIASATNSFNAALNGTLGAEDTSGSLPTGLTQLALGCLTSGSLVLNGHIRQIAYFNTRLPDAQLQTLTAPSAVTTLSLDFTSGSYTVGY